MVFCFLLQLSGLLLFLRGVKTQVSRLLGEPIKNCLISFFLDKSAHSNDRFDLEKVYGIIEVLQQVMNLARVLS